MILYLLKSTVCLGILWGVYKLFFEKEKLHHFNRFFLLLSLGFAFGIPWITIEMQPKQASLAQLSKVVEVIPVMNTIDWAKTVETENSFSVWDYLFVGYALIAFFFLIRFIRNLIVIAMKVRNNTHIHWNNAKLVLIDDATLPYTFGNFIFINKDAYTNALVEPELYSHELAHVHQKHSIDIIFLELLLIVFWFNPLVYLFKQAIQLNHEFLADDAVNKAHNNIVSYQLLLLNKASLASGIQLSSNLTFQITKTRLIMMTKMTSSSLAFSKKALTIPLFGVLALFFGNITLIAQDKPVKQSAPVVKSGVKKKILLKDDVDYKNGHIMLRDENGKISQKKYSELSEADKTLITNPVYLRSGSPTEALMNALKDGNKYGVWLNEKKVPNEELNKYSANDIADFFISKLYANARKNVKYNYQADLMTQKYYEEVYLKSVKENPLFMINKKFSKSK